MPPLVGSVDATKTHSEREFGERWSAFFLPGSTVKKIRNEASLLDWHRVILPRPRGFESQVPYRPIREDGNVDIRFRNGLDVRQLESAIDRIKNKFDEKEPSLQRIFIEADSLK